MRAGEINNVRVERGYFWESEFDNVGRPDSFVFLSISVRKKGMVRFAFYAQ
jgi:hypothetical protein